MDVFDLSARLMLDKSNFEQGLSSAVSVAVNAVTALGRTIYGATEATAEYGDHVDKMSQKIGISAEAYQKWDYVMKLCGTSVDNMQTGMKTLSSVIYDASQGTDSAVDKLSALGLTLEQLNGLSQEEQLQLVIERLQGMEAGAERTAIAVDVLGRSATDLAPLFNMSAEEMEKAMSDAESYGMIMSDDLVKASADFEDAQTKLKGTLEGTRNSLMSEFLPAITQVMDGLSDLAIGSDEAGAEISSGFDGIVKSINSATPKIATIITTLTNVMVKNAPSIIQNLASSIVESLPTLVTSIAEALPNTIMTLADIFMTNIPVLLDGLLDAVVTIANGLAESIRDGSVVEKIVTMITNIVEVILDNLDAMIDASIGLILALTDGLIEALPTLLERMPEIVSKIVTALINNLPKIVEAGIEFMLALSTAMLENIPLILDTIIAMVGELVIAVMDGAPRMAEGVVEWISQMIDKLKTEWENIKTNFKTLFDNWIPEIISFWTRFGEVAKEWIAGLLSKIEEEWKKITEAVSGFVNDLKDAFIEKVDAIKEAGATLISNFLEGLKDGWKKVTEWVSNVVSSLKESLSFDVKPSISAPSSYNKSGGSFDARTSSYSVEPVSTFAVSNASFANMASTTSTSSTDTQISLMQEQITLLQQILEKDTSIKTDSIFDAMQHSSSSYNRTTGLPSFA